MNQTHTHTRRSARSTIAAASVGLVAVLLAVAIFSNSSSAGAHAGMTAGETSAIATLRDHFALLRAPATTSPPAALATALAKAPVAYGLDLAAARHAAGANAWLVPGSGWLCIATQHAEGLGMSCATAESAERGELSLIERSSTSGEEHIVGACPDGYSAISALSPSSARLASGAVRESTYALSARNVSRVTVEQAP